MESTPIEFLSGRKKELLKYIEENNHLIRSPDDYLTHKEFLGSKNIPEAYYCYPELFVRVFSDENNTCETKLLNVAGYFYFLYILLLDKSLDSKKIDQSFLQVGLSCHEESIKILSNLFPLSSDFWNYWNLRKEEYLKALAIDRSPEIRVDMELFEKLSDFRSAFGKVAIDAWYVLSGAKAQGVYERLLKSHRFFSVGFQIQDDIQDFKKDYQIGQKNICHEFLKECLLNRGIDYNSLDEEQRYKYFFIEGVAGELLLKANDYFERAKKSVSSHRLKLKYWFHFIETKQREVRLFCLKIKGYEKTLLAKKFLSVTRKELPSYHPVKESLLQAYDYITGLQNPDGSWEEINLNAGLSNIWATGFILFNLPRLKERDDKPHRLAANFLKSNKQGNLWGYNIDWIQDTDSTTCVLLGLARNNIDISKEVEHWLKWQQPDGGFSTYNNVQELRAILGNFEGDVGGWIQSHTCVSALAYFFLSNYNRSCLQFKMLEEFVLEKSLLDVWKPYWWTSSIYPSVYALMGLMKSKSRDHYDVQEIVARIMRFQNEDGSFGDSFQKSNSFYTSLVLILLTSSEELHAKYHVQALRACRWLLSNQFSDGSFPSSTCLQLPTPQVVDPDQVKKWNRGHKGTNLVTTDFCRLFSTALACQALHQYSATTSPINEPAISINQPA